VGKGEHFPVFAQQNGGSAAGRLKADCPHIHGCEARVLRSACQISGAGGESRSSVFQERLSTGRGQELRC
jgi:hypothetical protein